MTTSSTFGPLFTDLYQLTMAAGYFEKKMDAPATFSLFVRPSLKRPYFVAAGLQEALEQISVFYFSDSDLDYLNSLALFKPSFLDYLAQLRFEGDIYAISEGSVFFGNEPLLEVTAPIIQAQLLETYLINVMGSATLIATKAARCVQAAKQRPLVDFSLRRTQGQTAGMTVARSSYLAGFSATSNVLAGKRLKIPITGTMAHSFVTAFESELEAFRAYAGLFPDASVFLIDTFDTIKGAHNAAIVGLEMQQSGHSLKGVRLDSGDMTALSREVRQILDQAGLYDVKIYASSGFDEYQIEELLAQKAKIDAFGVGTKMGVSADEPYLDIVYKLVRFKNRNVKKFSPAKTTLAGLKQVFRKQGSDGKFIEDVIATRTEKMSQARPLLEKVMHNGQIQLTFASLDVIRNHCRQQLAGLRSNLKKTNSFAAYPVTISAQLAAIQ
jgi:nicotinate phosphoribosyltransferase